jgi:hypothetical protein
LRDIKSFDTIHSTPDRNQISHTKHFLLQIANKAPIQFVAWRNAATRENKHLQNGSILMKLSGH